MVRIGSGGGGEFSIGSGEDGPSLDRLSEGSSKIGKFVTSQAKGETEFTLTGHVTANFKAPDYLQAMKQHYAED